MLMSTCYQHTHSVHDAYVQEREYVSHAQIISPDGRPTNSQMTERKAEEEPEVSKKVKSEGLEVPEETKKMLPYKECR